MVDLGISIDSYTSIDISACNSTVLDFNFADLVAQKKYINLYLIEQNNQVAYGVYFERRNLYDRSTYFENVTKHNKRNIYLGVDLQFALGIKVLAVLKGEVHSFKGNENYGDLGLTIIFKLLGSFENYPGASSENDIPFYRKNCLDLNLLLKLDLKAYSSFYFF